MKKLACFMGVSLFILSSCETVPKKEYERIVKENDNLKKMQLKIESSQVNQEPTRKDIMVTLPQRAQLYRKQIDLLIGDIIVFYDMNDQLKDIQNIGNYRKNGKQGGKATLNDLSSDIPLYSERITGKFGNNISMLSSSLTFNNEYVYDISLQPISNVVIKRDQNYFELKKNYKDILSKIKNKYIEIYLITAAEYRLLTYKEYRKFKTSGKIDVTMVKVNSDAFYSDDKVHSVPIMCFDGINLSNHFGNEVVNGKVTYYNKKSLPKSNNFNAPNFFWNKKQARIKKLKVISLIRRNNKIMLKRTAK